jgi:hypothetical protein
MQARRRYAVDPDDPRAPPQSVWDALSEDERRQILDSLPSEIPPEEAAPPEGDHHYDLVKSVREALRGHFRRVRRRIYVGSNLPVYYPGERLFSVDALAVLDVEDGPRNSWVVSAEGKGLDLALEIHWLGHRKKDFERNVVWFPALGITEYFVFDARRCHLRGFRLPGAGAKQYESLTPEAGRFTSEVLGLDLGVEGALLRFYAGNAALPDSEDVIRRLDAALASSAARVAEEAKRAEEEAKRAEEEAKRAEGEAKRAAVAEERLAEALAELQRLKKTRL